MKNPQKPERDHRDWEKPRAKAAYLRRLAIYAKEHQEEVARCFEVIMTVVEQHKRIEMLCVDLNLILTEIARLGGVRLYDEQANEKLTGYAKRLQGERQSAMREAFNYAVDEQLIIYRVNDLRRTVELPLAAKQPRRIFEEELLLLEDNTAARLRAWGEPVRQYI